MHLLVADDDQRLARLLVRGLSREGHVVDAVHDGNAALARALADPFDVLIVDVMMPGLDGFAVVERLRAEDVYTPVLLLTARGLVEDRVHGLNRGADDYLVKPFAFEELLARVSALARRRAPTDESLLTAGSLVIDLHRHEVTRDGRTVSLGPTEFRLLEFLVRHVGQPLSRETILANVWGFEAEPETNVVDLYVHYLRRKLGRSVPIATVRGVGYSLIVD